MWQIKYQNEFLDIAPNQSPEIERNSPLFLIENLLQENSTPFALAYSDKNSRLLGNYFFEQTRKARKKIDVEVYYNGSYRTNATLVIESAGMNYLFNGKAICSGYLLIGISNFFATIKDKKLTALTLGGDRVYSYTTSDPLDGSGGYWQHFQTIYDFSDDYVCPPYKNLSFVDDAEFTGVEQYPNAFTGTAIHVNQPVIPFVKLEYVLNEIFKEHGWKLDTSGLNDTQWQKLILYSNYIVSTTNWTFSTGELHSTPKTSITINLSRAMPPDVTCSTFLFEICKRYMWAPIFDLGTSTCRLVALKEMGNKPAKDWTKYASPAVDSEFGVDEKIFAFKNDFDNNDQYPSSPDFSAYPLIGFANSKNTLLPPAILNDNDLYYAFLENKWYRNQYDSSTHTSDWIEFADNIYDYEPDNATDTFETQVTTLPISWENFSSGNWGFLPVVNQERGTKWGIRTLIYHGMVPQVTSTGDPQDSNYPYASSINNQPSQLDQLTWSNVYKHSDVLHDYGIIEYWAKKWLQIISNVETHTRNIYVPFHELINFKWDEPVIIQNIPYLVKSFVQPLDGNEICMIQATLQPMKLVANAIAVDDGGDDDTTTRFILPPTLIAEDEFNYESLQVVKGDAGATVTIKLIVFTESFGASFYFKVNDSPKFLGNTFTVTLDGSGEGNFNVKIGGEASTFKACMVRLQIISTTSGTIGTPDIAQYDKITG